MSEDKSLKQRLLHELGEMFVIFAYLAFFFGAVATYRLMLPEPPAPALAAFGFALIKALVLAKVILLGRMVSVTRAFEDHPLIVPTLYKVVLFGVLALAFEALEHLAGGMIRGKAAADVIREVLSGHGWAILARTLVVLAAFVPFFAFTEASRVLGENRLREIFLRRRTPLISQYLHHETIPIHHLHRRRARPVPDRLRKESRPRQPDRKDRPASRHLRAGRRGG